MSKEVPRQAPETSIGSGSCLPGGSQVPSTWCEKPPLSSKRSLKGAGGAGKGREVGIINDEGSECKNEEDEGMANQKDENKGNKSAYEPKKDQQYKDESSKMANNQENQNRLYSKKQDNNARINPPNATDYQVAVPSETSQIQQNNSSSLAADYKLPVKKRKKKNEKMRAFAETIGVEDNQKYKRFKKKERLIFNISNTKYFIIRFVAKNLFNFKLSYKNQDPGQMDNWNYDNEGRVNDDWDIFWSDAGIQADRISKMKPYQKCNHYPGMFQLARKNHMARNLMKMQKEFDKAYKFFPRTFILPSEFGEFKQTFMNKTVANRPVYIVKPEAGCQGKGIFLTNNYEDLNPDDHYVVQKYIKKPMLIEDLKFDIRLYVMLLSVDPLRVYLFKEGMARFSTEPYKQPTKKNMSNMFMHLTNYSINCRNKGKFVFNKGLNDADQGHKRTFSSILEYIQQKYPDGDQKVDELMHQIEQLIIKTFITVLPSLRHYQNIPNKGQLTQEALDGTYNKNKNRVNSLCFEILGFDVLIDEKLKPWLIEINTAPSFATDTPFDFKIKKDVVADAIALLKMSYQLKKKFIKSHKSKVQKRMLGQKKMPQQSLNIQGQVIHHSGAKARSALQNNGGQIQGADKGNAEAKDQLALSNHQSNTAKIPQSQKFVPLIDQTPKNVSRIEESSTQKKTNSSKLNNDVATFAAVTSDTLQRVSGQESSLLKTVDGESVAQKDESTDVLAANDCSEISRSNTNEIPGTEPQSSNRRLGAKVTLSRVASAKERKRSQQKSSQQRQSQFLSRPVSARIADKVTKKGTAVVNASGAPGSLKPKNSSRRRGEDSSATVQRRKQQQTPVQSDSKAVADDITEEESLSSSDSEEAAENDLKTENGVKNTIKEGATSDNEDEDTSQDEEEAEQKIKNGYTLIYPSKRNPIEDYQAYIQHANYCYEQFTGSYSKKNREAREQQLRQQQDINNGLFSANKIHSNNYPSNSHASNRFMSQQSRDFQIRQQRTIQSPQKVPQQQQLLREQTFDQRLSQSAQKHHHQQKQYQHLHQVESLTQKQNVLQEMKIFQVGQRNSSYNQLGPDDLRYNKYTYQKPRGIHNGQESGGLGVQYEQKKLTPSVYGEEFQKTFNSKASEIMSQQQTSNMQQQSKGKVHLQNFTMSNKQPVEQPQTGSIQMQYQITNKSEKTQYSHFKNLNRATDTNAATIKTPPTTNGLLFKDMDGKTAKSIEISEVLPSKSYGIEDASHQVNSVITQQQVQMIDQDQLQNALLVDSAKQGDSEVKLPDQSPARKSRLYSTEPGKSAHSSCIKPLEYQLQKWWQNPNERDAKGQGGNQEILKSSSKLKQVDAITPVQQYVEDNIDQPGNSNQTSTLTNQFLEANKQQMQPFKHVHRRLKQNDDAMLGSGLQTYQDSNRDLATITTATLDDSNRPPPAISQNHLIPKMSHSSNGVHQKGASTNQISSGFQKHLQQYNYGNNQHNQYNNNQITSQTKKQISKFQSSTGTLQQNKQTSDRGRFFLQHEKSNQFMGSALVSSHHQQGLNSRQSMAGAKRINNRGREATGIGAAHQNHSKSIVKPVQSKSITAQIMHHQIKSGGAGSSQLIGLAGSLKKHESSLIDYGVTGGGSGTQSIQNSDRQLVHVPHARNRMVQHASTLTASSQNISQLQKEKFIPKTNNGNLGNSRMSQLYDGGQFMHENSLQAQHRLHVNQLRPPLIQGSHHHINNNHRSSLNQGHSGSINQVQPSTTSQSSNLQFLTPFLYSHLPTPKEPQGNPEQVAGNQRTRKGNRNASKGYGHLTQ